MRGSGRDWSGSPKPALALAAASVVLRSRKADRDGRDFVAGWNRER
jgi:hypothetical protein